MPAPDRSDSLDFARSPSDQGDFAAAMAPRPFMLWAPLNDIGMPNEGLDRFLEVVRPAYARSRAKDALLVHRPQREHAFTLEAFEAMVAFFDQQLKLGMSTRILPIVRLDRNFAASICGEAGQS